MIKGPWDSLYQALEQWKTEGVNLLPGGSEAEVRETLDQTGRSYCDDVVEMYQITGGMIPYESCNGLLSLWSLEQVLQENKASASELLLFGDFLIFSHVYGFNVNPDGRSSVCISLEDTPLDGQQIADSPQEFFRKYVERSADLLLMFDA